MNIKKGLLKRNSHNGGIDAAAEQKLKEVASKSKNDLLGMLETGEKGITGDEAKERIRTHGPNEVAHEKAPA